MVLGHRSDRWINLFNTYSDDESDKEAVSADAFVRRAESIVLQEYARGGKFKTVMDKTDQATDKVIDHLRNRRDVAGKADPPPGENPGKNPGN